MERQTVLIVDDSELNRMMLMEILGEQYHYIEAQNGREAVRLMEKKLTVDLMLLDINMPEMNGFQVLEQMNRFRWIDEIPVIMISTDETNQAIQQAYAMGVTDYIRRPFDTFIVRHRVENTLKLYANQKRLMYLVSDQIREKEENSNLMVGILSHVVEFRNHEGGDHIRNIRSITELLLRRLVEKTKAYHLSEEDIALIKTASALHDIGKITIPEEILNKPGKLTSEEFAVMKTHAAAGAVILEQMTFGQEKPLFRYALEICRWHHERWDGHGYPDGLRGERIPIAAQVVALADVYNALTSERCYKKAFDHDTAIAMILGGECGAFNPLLLECLADVSPRLRITSHVPLDGDPYRLEVNRLSDELLARADPPRNDRVQRILESLQERIDFFASCSGGIQFEFDALSGLADITNWDEPPQYRHTVKNAAHPECFCRLSQKDFHRLQEAMAATTKETPEFSVSLLLPCGTEHHWCDLRVRTLWSDRQPEHYVGAVGQLVDPQLSVKKPLLLSAADVNTEDGTLALAAEMRRLRMVFDVVRLVDPTTNSVLELDEQGVLHPNGSHCAAFWDNGRSCANCISSRALAQKTTLNKLEFTNTDMYFVISKYLCLNGMPCVLEMLSKLSEGRWIDANGTRLLLDHSRAENMELFMDPLTNTYARRYFESYRSHLEGMEHVAIIDVDSFKQVNDAYGHQTGDTVLRDIVAAIHSCIRSTDTLIRYGGDEFLLLFPKMDEHIFVRKQNEIREAVRRIVIPEYPELHLSVSIGGVSGVHPLAEAIRQADYLMYENKEKYYTEGEHVTPPPENGRKYKNPR